MTGPSSFCPILPILFTLTTGELISSLCLLLVLSPSSPSPPLHQAVHPLSTTSLPGLLYLSLRVSNSQQLSKLILAFLKAFDVLFEFRFHFFCRLRLQSCSQCLDFIFRARPHFQPGKMANSKKVNDKSRSWVKRSRTNVSRCSSLVGSLLRLPLGFPRCVVEKLYNAPRVIHWSTACRSRRAWPRYFF